MWIDRSKTCLVAGVTLALAACCAAQSSAPASQASAYDKLDQAKLAETLCKLQMTELLDEMVSESTANLSAKSLWAIAQAKLAQASAEVGDLSRRHRLLDEAAAMLQRLIAAAKPATRDDELASFRYRVAYFDLVGRLQCRIHAEEYLMLMGGDDDLQIIRRCAAQALIAGDGPSPLDQLQSALADAHEKWSQSSRDLILYVPQLERVQDDLRTSAAWIQLYAALAQSDPAMRQRLLQQAIAAADKFAKGETDDGIADPSCLYLQGVATLQLALAGQADALPQADALLDQAAKLAAANRDTATAVQATFQRVRGLIEAARFADAQAAIDRFGPAILNVLGPQASVQADVNVALLRHHLYERWAQAEVAQAPILQAKAQAALMEFVAKYHDQESVTSAFLRMVASRYAGQKNLAALSPVVQLSIAMSLYEDGLARLGDDLAGGKARLAQAADVFRLIIAANEPLAVALHPLAQRRLGLALYRLGSDPAAAMDALQQAGTPDDLLNACIIGKNALEAGDVHNPTDLRKKFIEVLHKLLALPGRPDLAVWNIDLAEQYRQLADVPTPDAAALDNLRRAIAAYDAVPADNPRMRLEARRLALTMQFRLIEALRKSSAPPADISMQAASLLGACRAYVAQVQSAVASADSGFARNLRQWGASAEFISAILLYEQLNQPDEALKILAGLPGRWPGAAVLLDAKEYEIRKRIEKHQTDAAVAEIDALNATHPEQADDLMPLVIAQLRDRIDRLRNDPSVADELARSQQAYLEFASLLLRKHSAAAPEARYPYQQMYADALLANGRAAEALASFDQLNTIESQKRKARQAAIDVEIGALQTNLARVKSDPAAVRKLAAELPSLVSARRIDSDRRGYVQALRIAMNYLDQAAPDSADMPLRVQAVADRLRDAYAGLRRDLRNAIPRDSINLWGLARANLALGSYSQAIRYYKQLADGLDPLVDRREYGRAQLEFCQCSAAAAHTLPEPEQRRKMQGFLVLRIEEFGRTDADFWGYKADFDRLLAQARLASSQPQ